MKSDVARLIPKSYHECHSLVQSVLDGTLIILQQLTSSLQTDIPSASYIMAATIS
jgi:hypoxanthine-guanine phosphoribosyltransferase